MAREPSEQGDTPGAAPDGQPHGGFRVRLAELRRLVRELGWLDGSLFAFAWALAKISGRRIRLYKYYFVKQPVTDRPFLSSRRGSGIEIRQVQATDHLLEQCPRPPAVIGDRFRQGAICLAAVSAGRCVGFIWFTLGAYQEDEVRCRYVPIPEGRSSWDFDVFVIPEHRSGIAFLKLWDAANAFLTARGVRCSFSRISAFNIGSLAAHRRMGARPMGSAVFLSLGSWQASAATVRPHFHFSARPGSFPVYTLPASDGTD